MSIRVNDFQWEPGKNDAEYIKLLKSSRDEWQKIAQKAIAKLKALQKAQEPVEPYRDDEGTYTCGACGKSVVGYANWNTLEVEQIQKYCSECGQAVKWNG